MLFVADFVNKKRHLLQIYELRCYLRQILWNEVLFVAYLLTKIILVADFIVLDPFMTDFMILNVVMLCDIFFGCNGFILYNVHPD